MEVPLEVSQVKQIAGRAGRYGMGVESGVVTTLGTSRWLDRDDRARCTPLLLGASAEYGRDGSKRQGGRDNALYRLFQPGLGIH